MQIPTNNGSLEAQFQPPTTTTSRTTVALLCHPHPLYGGSMHDRVLDEAALCFPAHLRFNFRGVGGSTGLFDNGVGEADDVVSAWLWLRAQDEWQEMTLIGYSFGAAMVWQAQDRCPGLDRLILIAPPSAAMPLRESTESAPRSYPCDVIAGDQDDFFDASNLPQSCRQTVIPGADHFFGNALTALASAITGPPD